jgi:hypothetical protein
MLPKAVFTNCKTLSLLQPKSQALLDLAVFKSKFNISRQPVSPCQRSCEFALLSPCILLAVKTVPGASYVTDLVAINGRHILQILWHKLKAFWMWFAYSPSLAKREV